MKFDSIAKRTLVGAAMLLAIAGQPAWAANTATVSLSPSSQTVNINDLFSVSVKVDSASDLIGAYDFGVLMGTAGVASLQSVTFSGALGSDAIQTQSLPGSFAEVSLALSTLDLSPLQSGAFTLATLNFKALAVGTTTVALSPTLFGDFNGDAMDLTLSGATVTVQDGMVGAIPEPSTYVLMGACLAVVAGAVRRKKG